MNKIWYWIIGLLLSLFGLFGLYQIKSCNAPFWETSLRKRYKVKKVIDGDTIELENSIIVRLFGIDCPEVYKSYKSEKLAKYENYWGQKATQFTNDYISIQNNFIYLDLITKDAYGRSVAIIYKTRNSNIETSLNLELIKHGFAIPAYLDINNARSPYYLKNAFTIEFYHLSNSIFKQAQKEKKGINANNLKYVFHKKRQN